MHKFWPATDALFAGHNFLHTGQAHPHTPSAVQERDGAFEGLGCRWGPGHRPGGADGEYAGMGRLRVLAAELHLNQQHQDLQSGGSWAKMQQSGREWFFSRATH